MPNNLRGGEGSQNMPGFFRGGGFDGFRSHLDISEPGGPGSLPPHLRIGDPAFNGRFGLVSLSPLYLLYLLVNACSASH